MKATFYVTKGKDLHRLGPNASFSKTAKGETSWTMGFSVWADSTAVSFTFHFRPIYKKKTQISSLKKLWLECLIKQDNSKLRFFFAQTLVSCLTSSAWLTMLAGWRYLRSILAATGTQTTQFNARLRPFVSQRPRFRTTAVKRSSPKPQQLLSTEADGRFVMWLRNMKQLFCVFKKPR